jgi:hypothetical protein
VTGQLVSVTVDNTECEWKDNCQSVSLSVRRPINWSNSCLKSFLVSLLLRRNKSPPPHTWRKPNKKPAWSTRQPELEKCDCIRGEGALEANPSVPIFSWFALIL